MFEQSSFDEGVAFGGLRSTEEIKLLISYVLAKVDQSVSKSKLCDILMEDSIANYFEINNCLAQMINSGVILCKLDSEGNEELILMAKGLYDITSVENLLPRSIRQKALSTANKILHREQVEKGSNITVDKVEGGYLVNFEIIAGNDPLFKLSIFVTNSTEIETVKRNFCDKAVSIYSNIMTDLLVD